MAEQSKKISYPIRLNKFLLESGLCSRRQADKYIESGLVKVNGEKATLGQKITVKDKVEIDQEIKKLNQNRTYLAYFKPKGVVTNNPLSGEKQISDILDAPKDLRPIGRLDKNSHGLILLSNDSRISNLLLNPDFEHEKEYEIILDKRIDLKFIRAIETGVKIENYLTKPAKIKKVSPTKAEIILTEGKKHQIRRMAAALGYRVKDLKRVRIMNIKLGGLKPNQARKIKDKELNELFATIGL